MSDNEQVIQEEKEVLESIYPELEQISPTQLALTIEPDTPSSSEPLSIRFTVSYPPSYPDVLPDITLDPETGELSALERDELMEELRVLGEENLGMAMVFSLVSALQESLSSLIVRRVERKRAEEDRKEKEAEEAAAARLKGTAVTPESFLSWRKKFLLERKRGKEKEEEERLRNLPPKEREEAKRSKSKLTGRQLFQTDKSLATSDQTLEEDDAVEVDLSQYNREDRHKEEEEENEHQGLLRNDD